MPHEYDELIDMVFELVDRNGNNYFNNREDAEGPAVDNIKSSGIFDDDNIAGKTHEEIIQEYKEYVKEEIDKEADEKNYDEDVGRHRDPVTGRFYKVGCDFGGVKEIKEYDDAKIYIPSSHFCGVKCYEKYFKKKSDRKEMDPYGSTLNSLRKYAKKNFSNNADEIPQFIKSSKKGMVTTDGNKLNKSKNLIYLLKANKIKGVETIEHDHIFYHAILCKTNRPKDIDEEYILSKIELTKDKKLDGDAVKLKLPKDKEKHNIIYPWDIETSTLVKEDGGKKQVLESACYYKLDFKDFNDKIKKHTKKFGKKDISMKTGKDAIMEMIKDVCKNHNSESPVIFMAHNGGRFDNIYVKNIKNEKLIFLEEINSAGCIKKLICEYKGQKIIFLDSLCFMQAKLETCCKYFDIGTTKDKFDIANKPHSFFVKTKEWIQYALQDVVVLTLLIFKFEKMLRKMGESMTNTVGIPTVAWDVLSKTCYGMKKLYIAKNPVTSKFITDSCYGGRVLHWKKIFVANKTLINGKTSKGLVSLDANSLYPSAMKKGCFPIGPQFVIEKMKGKQFIKEFMDRGYLSIVEVIINSNNVRYPLLPYRTKKGDILYPSGRFKGVYNSVDLSEAINDGYEIEKVCRGVYWKEKKIIFDEIITYLYEKRKDLKKEKNSLEYVYKILLNSTYGKFNEKIKTSEIFINEKNGEKKYDGRVSRFNKLKNGQAQIKINLTHSVMRKPHQIASFITAYARQIMNNYIRQIGGENIFYSDTDSIYLPIEKAKKIKLDDNLGGIKNDYGDGIIIEKAIFLDIKRYFLKFNKPDKKGQSFVCKFNGLNFTQKNCMQNWTSDKLNDENAILEMMVWLGTHPDTLIPKNKFILQDKWRRNVNNVTINAGEFIYQINPDKRNDWKGNNAFPKQYDHDEKENKLGPITKFIDGKSLHYSLTKRGLESNFPVMAEKTIVLKAKDTNNFKTSHAMDKHGNIFIVEGLFKDKAKNKYFKQEKFGKGKEVKVDKKDLKPIITIKESSDKIQKKLGDKEFEAFKKTLKKLGPKYYILKH
jgi:hypothetical protein